MSRGFSIFTRLSRQALGLLGGILVLGATGSASAQAPLPSAKPAAQKGAPTVTKPAPPAGGVIVTQPAPQPLNVGGAGYYGQASGHGQGGGHFVLDSILDTGCCVPWTPLCCSNLGEGWTDAWIRPPSGPSGAPRQVWLNSADGFFTREFHLFYFWTDNIAKLGDAHTGLFQFQTPLSRRLWVGFDVPFVGLTNFGGDMDTARFGDLTITPKVMLTETQDMSLSAGLAVRTASGTRATGDDQFVLTPFTALWTDLGSGVSLRGGIGVEVPINDYARSILPDAVLVSNLAIGQTLTGTDGGPFRDFSYYVALNLRRDLGDADGHTFLSITPGLRTNLGNNWSFLAAYEVPVVGPRQFDQRFMAGIIKGF